MLRCSRALGDLTTGQEACPTADFVDFDPLAAALPAGHWRERPASHFGNREFWLVVIETTPNLAHQLNVGPAPLRLPHAREEYEDACVTLPIGRIDTMRGEIRQTADGYGAADVAEFGAAEGGGEGPHSGDAFARIIACDELRGCLLQPDEIHEGQVVFEGERIGWVPKIAGDQSRQQGKLASNFQRTLIDGHGGDHRGVYDGQHGEQVALQHGAADGAEKQHIDADEEPGDAPGARRENVAAPGEQYSDGSDPVKILEEQIVETPAEGEPKSDGVERIIQVVPGEFGVAEHVPRAAGQYRQPGA